MSNLNTALDLGQDVLSTKYAFNAYNPAITVDGYNIRFSSVRFNVGNAYNTANGLFTAPESGYYQFSFSLLVNTTGPGYMRVYWNINGVANSTNGESLEGLGGHSWGSPSDSTTIFLNAGDYVACKNVGNNTYGTAYGSFSGSFLGR